MNTDRRALLVNIAMLAASIAGAWAYWTPVLNAEGKPGITVYATAYGVLAYMIFMGATITVWRLIAPTKRPDGIYTNREWCRRVDAALAKAKE